VLSDLDLEVAKGEIVAVVGPSGCGKTTLLNIIGGLDRRYEGSVRVAGQHLDELADRQLSRYRNGVVGTVLQGLLLIDGLTALENISFSQAFSKAKLDPRRQYERLHRLAMHLGIEQLLHVPVEQLSGGQRQRVAIVRALYHRPRLLLCDELTGHLDLDTGSELLDLLSLLRENEYLTVIVVSHERYVSEAADRVLSLKNGRLLEAGYQVAGEQS
jgi:putative ABC transport system ATP-binding protein